MNSILIFISAILLFSLSSFLFPIDIVWYSKLRKPKWTPPSKLFGLVWGVLYVLISISLAIVEWRIGILNTSYVFLLVWLVNYICNQAFSFFQFKLKRLDLATIDCILVSMTSVYLFFLTISYSITSAVLLIPYAIWTIFASFLSFNIYRLNKK